MKKLTLRVLAYGFLIAVVAGMVAAEMWLNIAAGLLSALFIYGAVLAAAATSDRLVIPRIRGSSFMSKSTSDGFIGMGLLVMAITGLGWIIAVGRK